MHQKEYATLQNVRWPIADAMALKSIAIHPKLKRQRGDESYGNDCSLSK